MKASELIKRLQELIEEHGDLDVYKGVHTIVCVDRYCSYDEDDEFFAID